MKTKIRVFLSDESAAVAIEYGLIAVIICLAIIAALNNIGSQLNTIFANVRAGFSK